MMVLLLNDMAHLVINLERLQFFKCSTVAILVTTLLETYFFPDFSVELGC